MDKIALDMLQVIQKASKDWLDGPMDRKYQIRQRDFEMQALFEAGYRLDPYPNGKSKGELIARIEELEAERDKTRNLLRSLLAVHDKLAEYRFGEPLDHWIQAKNARIFLTETSLVPETKMEVDFRNGVDEYIDYPEVKVKP